MAAPHVRKSAVIVRSMGAHRSGVAATCAPLPRAQRSLLRIATTISFLLAIIPFAGGLASGADLVSLALALAWVLGWGAAVLAPEWLASMVARWPARAAVVAIGSLVVTIIASGGPDSALKNGLNWLPWVYLVAATPRVACAVATCTSAAMAVSIFASEPGWVTQTPASDRFFLLTEVVNPLLVAAVGIVLVAVFRRVVTQVDDVAAEVAAGGDASTPALAAVIAGPGRAELPMHAMSDAEQARAVLRQGEREVVDLLAEGLTPQQIALMQQRSDDAVYRTISAAKQRVGARTIEHLVAVAWRPAR